MSATTRELHPEPAKLVVIGEHLRAVGVAVRKEGMLAGVVLLGYAVFLFLMNARGDWFETTSFEPDMFHPAMLLALIVPLAVWKAETPERRTYLWSEPVSRTTSHLAKVASGWVWMMLAMAAYAIWLWAMAKATGGEIWTDRQRPFWDISTGEFTPEDLRVVTVRVEDWRLLVPFMAATTLYLFSTILVLASNYPFRWAAGLWFIGFLTAAIIQTTESEELMRAAIRVIDNETWYGVGNLVDPVVPHPELIPGTGEIRPIERGSLSHWLTATSLWMGIALVGTYVAARKHREP